LITNKSIQVLFSGDDQEINLTFDFMTLPRSNNSLLKKLVV